VVTERGLNHLIRDEVLRLLNSDFWILTSNFFYRKRRLKRAAPRKRGMTPPTKFK
jgi:hypothetical protein